MRAVAYLQQIGLSYSTLPLAIKLLVERVNNLHTFELTCCKVLSLTTFKGARCCPSHLSNELLSFPSRISCEMVLMAESESSHLGGLPPVPSFPHLPQP